MDGKTTKWRIKPIFQANQSITWRRWLKKKNKTNFLLLKKKQLKFLSFCVNNKCILRCFEILIFSSLLTKIVEFNEALRLLSKIIKIKIFSNSKITILHVVKLMVLEFQTMTVPNPGIRFHQSNLKKMLNLKFSYHFLI